VSGKVVAIIPAAGAGTRLVGSGGTDECPKALRLLAGRTLLQRSVDMLEQYVDEIVVALPALWAVACEIESTVAVSIVEGGTTRQRSVSMALDALDDDVGWVLVHDAARPLVPGAVVQRVLDALAEGASCVVPTVEPADSLRAVSADRASAPLERSQVRLVQTPQGFRADALRRAHDAARPDASADATDDASLVEATGVAVTLVEGDPLAFKITRPLDLLLAEALLAASP